MKSKEGFILLWTLSIVILFFSWVSITLSNVNDLSFVKKQRNEVKERLIAEKQMRDKFNSGDVRFDYVGKYIHFTAILEDKKITVNVQGTTKYNYVYAIMEDESLVLVTTEE